MKLFGKIIAYPILAVNAAVSLLMVFSSYCSLAPPVGRLPFASLSGLAFPFLLVADIAFLLFWLLFWRKAALLPAITVLVCLPAVLDCIPMHIFNDEKGENADLTLMTYNTQGFGNKKYGNISFTEDNPVLAEIVKSSADIIVLQESVHQSLEKVCKSGLYSDIYPYISYNAGNSAMAVISKYPVLSSEIIRFEGSSGNSLMYARLLVEGDTLALYNCHLQSNSLQDSEIKESQHIVTNPTDSSSYDASKKVIKKLLRSTSLRASQARLVADMVKKETAAHIIVCGDFNDTPLSYSHRVFDRFMTDTYAKSGRGPGNTYHDYRLHYRIDHIFCSRNFTPVRTYVDRSYKDSDHYPVITKLNFK